jgi:hypothetical protein
MVRVRVGVMVRVRVGVRVRVRVRAMVRIRVRVWVTFSAGRKQQNNTTASYPDETRQCRGHRPVTRCPQQQPHMFSPSPTERTITEESQSRTKDAISHVKKTRKGRV